MAFKLKNFKFAFYFQICFLNQYFYCFSFNNLYYIVDCIANNYRTKKFSFLLLRESFDNLTFPFMKD